MTNSGLRTIDYASGRTSRIEVAARRAIMTAVTQVTTKVTEQNMEKLHTDYVEVSWHETARPTHQVWQGRVFKWNRNNDADNKIQNMEKQSISVARRKQAQSLRNDSKYQDTIRQRKEEWKKRHSEFDKATAKTEINNIKSQIADMQKQINASLEKEKPLEKKVYIDGTGTDEDMRILRQSATERKKMQEQVEVLNGEMLDKQEVYKNEAQNRLIKAGTIEEIKLSKKMTPDTVDVLEDTLTKLKDKYGIMPKGVVYNPSKVPDATVTYNWVDDNIYISNRFNDINNYADIVNKSEYSLIEYREKAVINKAEAEIELNTQRMAVRENLMDTLTHEYGHFIHRHANADYVQKSSVFGAKDLGGKLINGDWKYDINSHYSANAKIEAAKISKYATESPYEAFAEDFLAKEKGQEIPESIEKVIKEAKVKAGVKNVANGQKNGILGSTKDERILDVHPIGKINKEIYKCITDDILTDEVVITNNQIQHIMDRHPNDYERFSSYFGEIVKNPDYIIEANKPNTALLLKEIKENDEIFKTVLRLVTSKDNPNYKNSIITFMKIDEKEWNRLLRNKTILYKKE